MVPRTNDDQVEEVEVEASDDNDVVYLNTATKEEQKEAGPPSDALMKLEATTSHETVEVVEKTTETKATNDYQAESEVEVAESEDDDFYSSAATMVLQMVAGIPPDAPPVSSELMKNDSTTSHDEPKNAAEAGEKTSKTGTEAESSTRKSDVDWKPASGWSDALKHQTKQSSVPVENGSIPSTNVVLLAAESGSMPEAGGSFPVDRSTSRFPNRPPNAERDGKPQLTPLDDWGTSQDDHARTADFETRAKGVHHSQMTSPTRTRTQDSQRTRFPNPPLARHSKGPAKFVDTRKAPVTCSTPKHKDVSAGIMEWQMFSKMNQERNRSPKAYAPQTAPEIYNMTGNAGTNESSSCPTLNCMEPVSDEPKSMTANLDWSSTDKKEKSEAPVKSVNAPFLANSLPVEMATNIKQGASDTKSDRGAHTSMPAPPPRGMLLHRLKVKLPKGKNTFIQFHDGDCLQTVAERWCRVWKVPNASTQAKTIVDAIYTRLDKYLG